MSKQVTGFGAVADPDARVLILGSMPGEESLRQGRYYGHPRNAFWGIMGVLFGAGPELPYGARLDRLRARRVALWDVVHQCRRGGSLDASIEEDSVEANDIPGLLGVCPCLRSVVFNGRAAERLYRVHILPRLGDRAGELHSECLPSTSPAHASRSEAEKLRSWRVVKDLADGRDQGEGGA